MVCSSLLIGKTLKWIHSFSFSLSSVSDQYFRKKEERIQDLPKKKSHSGRSHGNALFWLQSQYEMKESMILFTQMKLKNKTQKQVVYVMVTLLEAVVSSVFWKSELEKAISDHFSHQSRARWAVAWCILFLTGQPLPMSSIQAPVVIYLVSASLFSLAGNSLSPDWQSRLKPRALQRLCEQRIIEQRVRLELQLEEEINWAEAWLCCFDQESVFLG